MLGHGACDYARGQAAAMVEDHFEVMGWLICPVASLKDNLDVIGFSSILE